MMIFSKVFHLSDFIRLADLCPLHRQLVKYVYNIETVQLKNKILCYVL